MKGSLKRTLAAALLAAACLSLPACRDRRSPAPESPEAVLAQMREDGAWIRMLDSLAALAIGPGAVCVDPVWHLFRRDGRLFFHNHDWGGVLEIPDGYTPQDDLWQAELSFHGTSALSADTLSMVSFYAGFQPFGEDEYPGMLRTSLEDEGFTVTDVRKGCVDFGDGTVSPVYSVSAEGPGGVSYRARHIWAGPDHVEYSVAVQWHEGAEEAARDLLRMAERYPFSPDGRFIRGEAVK